MFTTNYRFTGKHATYVKFLNAYTKNLDKTAEVAGVFAYAIDVYMIAPLIGVAYNRRSPVDTNTTDSINILESQFLSRQDKLENVYRLIMLSEKSSDLSTDDRIERAFKDDEAPEKIITHMDLFHQYMRGGIEWLYEFFTDGASSQDDYLGKINELVKQFADDFELTESVDLEGLM
jgi:hypothetical protein